jgi:cytochrome c-type biogenesis protein CcmH
MSGPRHSRESGNLAPSLSPAAPKKRDFRFRGNDVLCAILLSVAAPAFAQSALPPSRYAYTQLEDPRREAEAKALMETLRCLVCQGQSIADSDADMAGDMRALVRERIAAGEKPEAIRAWLVDRYGAWVSYRPPVEPLTWPLWAAPAVLIALGFYLARGRFRRKAR